VAAVDHHVGGIPQLHLRARAERAILWTLFGELSRQIAVEQPAARSTLRGLRVVLLVTWSFYPIAYLFPLLLPDAATAFVLVNVGYAIADITAKAGYGLMIHHVAKVKTELEEQVLVA
jgi:bacteriorhodopsin